MTNAQLKILQDEAKERYKNNVPYTRPVEVEKFIVKKRERKDPFSDEAFARRWRLKQEAAKAIADKINNK